MQPGPLPRQQVAVDGLAQQGVPEDVAFGAVRHEQLVRDRLADRGLVFVRLQPRRGLDQLVVRLAAGHRGGAEHPLRGVGHLLDPAEQQGGQPGREGAAVVGAAADRGGDAEGGGEQFLGVVGVAFGPGHDVIEHGGVDAHRGGGGQVFGQGRGIQRRQVDGDDAGQPLQFGRQRPERMAPVQVVAPVAADQRDPFPVQHPGQEGDQVPGRGVGPVQVLQHEQDRGGGRELGEQAEHAAEHLLPGQAGPVLVRLLAVPALGQQPVQGRARAECVADPARLGGTAQRVGQRQVGNAVAQLGAVAGQHGEAAPGGECDGLADESGLAHARVPADERDHRPACLGVVEQGEQAA